MNFFFDVSIPAGTAQKTPYEEVLKLTYGVITHVQIVIPTGHLGKAHLVGYLHEFQIYPLSRGEDYHGDDATISFADRTELFSSPFELKVRGWNTDAANVHSFLVSVEILLPDQIGHGTGTLGIGDLQEIVGVDIEV
jgi:hypothetical protein